MFLKIFRNKFKQFLKDYAGFIRIKLQDNKYKTFSSVDKINRRRIWPTNIPFKPETSKFQKYKLEPITQCKYIRNRYQ